MCELKNVRCAVCGATDMKIVIAQLCRVLCYAFCSCRGDLPNGWNTIGGDQQDDIWERQALIIVDWNTLSLLKFRLFVEVHPRSPVNVSKNSRV